MRKLAETGRAEIRSKTSTGRDALWESERVTRFAGPLLDRDEHPTSVLAPMNRQERLIADFHGTGLTVGRHPMAPSPPGARWVGLSAAPIELKNHSQWPLRPP